MSKCKGNLMKGTMDALSLETQFCRPFASVGVGQLFISDGFVPTWSLGKRDAELQSIANSLNALATSSSLWTPLDSLPLSSMTALVYTESVTCANMLAQMVEWTASNVNPVYVLETKILEDGREMPTKQQHSGMSMYHFSLFGMYEYPLSWFYKCTLQAAIYASSTSNVYCDEWKHQIDLDAVSPVPSLIGAKSTSVQDTWQYLKRLNAGLSRAAYMDNLASNIAAWSETVERIYDTLRHEEFYDHVESGGKLKRTCSTRREIVRYFADTSKIFAEELKRSLFLNQAGNVWSTSFGPNDVCYGVFSSPDLLTDDILGSNTPNGLPPCTIGLGRVFQATDAAILKRVATSYFQTDPVHLFDFLQQAPTIPDPLQGNLGGGASNGGGGGGQSVFPVLVYKNIALDVNASNGIKLFEDRLAAMYNSLEMMNDGNCILQDLRDAEDKECFIQRDDTIALFEKANPHYKTLQKKKAYVIAAWGSNNPYPADGTWPAVKELYDGNTPNGGPVQDAAIFTPSDVVSLSQDKFAMPDLGVGVMDITIPGWKLENAQEANGDASAIDAFCSLYEEGASRLDPCTSPEPLGGPNAELGIKMGKGPADRRCAFARYSQIDRLDVNHGQTCVPLSKCMWKNDRSKIIQSPNWRFEFYRDWVDDYKGFSDNNTFHAKDIWRWTIDPRHTTEFYLPVGVFLQTFRPQLVEAKCNSEGHMCTGPDNSRWTTTGGTYSEKGNTTTPVLFFSNTWQGKDYSKVTQFWNRFDLLPHSALGMWPMCPHDQSFMAINAEDAYKSSMIRSDGIINTNYVYKPAAFTIPQWLPRHPWSCFLGICEKYLEGSQQWAYSAIQQTLSFHPSIPIRPDAHMGTQKMFPHSDDRIQKCTVRDGYVNFRIGLAPGYVINENHCPNLTYAYPVMGSIKRCIACSTWTPKYCTGNRGHECRFHIVSDAGRIRKWTSLPYVSPAIKLMVQQGDASATVLDFVNAADANPKLTPPIWRRSRMTDASAIKSLVALLGNFLLSNYDGNNKKYASVNSNSMPIYAKDKANWKDGAAKSFPEYNPNALVTYEASLPPLANPASDASIARCTGTRFVKDKTVNVYTVNYKACNFSSQYEHLRRIIGNQTSTDSLFRVKEGIIIPSMTRIAYWASKSMMVSNGLPSWALHTRAAGDIFVQNLLNATVQCSHGDVRTSICSFSDNQLYVMNPW